MSINIYQERRIFYENLSLLVKSEQLEIFKILKKYNEKYTENSNGIFFDLMSLSETAYTEIKKFMDFCLATRKEDSIRTKVMEDMAAECLPLERENSSSLSVVAQ